jgi:hypothetical protein
MQGFSEYRYCRAGRWRLLVHEPGWSRELWDTVLSHLTALSPASRPQVIRLRFPPKDQGPELYLKVFYPWRFSGTVKDLLRGSRAFRALKQGAALSREGFHIPLTLAAGEERVFRLLRRSFLLTLGVEASPLYDFLEGLPCLSARERFRRKRENLKRLASEVSRLHRLGFVHGDLTASNILAQARANDVTYFFVDHDRTRRHPKWFAQLLWRKNLVQLNRSPLPGIFVQDRLRFLRFYLNGRPRDPEERRLACWLEKKTRQRYFEGDRVGAPVGFRKLMQWKRRVSADVP